MKRFIFLDIDGVLWSRGSATEDTFLRNPPECETTGMVNFGRREVNLFNFLLAHSSAHIVIHSTWRKLYTLEDILKHFKIQGINVTEGRFSLAGRGYSISQSRDKSYAVDEYLDKVREDYRAVVLDDDERVQCRLARTVIVENYNGLSFGDAVTVSNHLEENYPFPCVLF